MLNKEEVQESKVVYSIFDHEIFGSMMSAFVVEMDAKGQFSFVGKKIGLPHLEDYKALLTPNDIEIIKLLNDIELVNLIKKISGKLLKPRDFFAKKIPDEQIEYGKRIVENRLAKALQKLLESPLFLMGIDGIPTWKRIKICEEPATILFHFIKNEEGTRYYPTVRYKGELINFRQTETKILTNSPFWMLSNDTLFYFKEEIDGKKLQPFLKKYYIQVPPSAEEKYYRQFMIGLIEKFSVRAEGFKIYHKNLEGKPILKFTKTINSQAAFLLMFDYNDRKILANNQQHVAVSLEEHDNTYTFYKTSRNSEWEKAIFNALIHLGLFNDNGAIFGLFKDETIAVGNTHLAQWASAHKAQLNELGFIIDQEDLQVKYNFAVPDLQLSINQNSDWFDIGSKVTIGQFEIPFVKLRYYILNQIQEYILPDGSIAVLPAIWFTKLREFFYFLETDDEQHRIQAHHISLIRDLQEMDAQNLIPIKLKVGTIDDFDKIEDVALPQNFTATLRPYQRSGLNWLWFLNKYKFGGCLADDMGLGKTVQTLALLVLDKEKNQPILPNLLVVPTSLIYNWYVEAKKFAPGLIIKIHSGSSRNKIASSFTNCDLVITSYGLARQDELFFNKLKFNYIILDEAQTIKNPRSKTARIVKKYNAKYRLVLTGTPVENSVIDLWSVMSFANPGALGTLAYFKDQFANPIEKKNDAERLQKLKAMVNPFLLRRTKDQVADDLPPKTEEIVYCGMTELQEEIYERNKSSFRNEILEQLSESPTGKRNMMLLRGLTILRQLANHPQLVENDYAGSSGKFKTVTRMLENALEEKHKILVFSQFVRHLALFKTYCDQNSLPYFYLDGQTPTQERVHLVEQFNGSKNVNLFFISLKAGGLGLNLTSADYVFLLDPWWNPAVEAQAIDRAHRIGQKQKVISYRFITQDTVEEKIVTLQAKKRNLSERLIQAEQNFVKTLTIDDIRAILS